MIPKVVQVVPIRSYQVYVYFEDGKIVCYNMALLLDKEVFAPLKDVEVFINTCTVLNDTLAWDLVGKRDVTQCLDIDPCTLYDLPQTEEYVA